jgi:hypothetical protein
LRGKKEKMSDPVVLTADEFVEKIREAKFWTLTTNFPEDPQCLLHVMENGEPHIYQAPPLIEMIDPQKFFNRLKMAASQAILLGDIGE